MSEEAVAKPEAAQPEAPENTTTLRRTQTQAWDYGEYLVVPDIQIVGPRLLVVPAKMRDFETASGVVVPAHAQKAATRGLIVLVGDGIVWENGTREESRFKPGMEVVYAQFAGIELELGNNQFMIIQESDVRCILEEHKLTVASIPPKKFADSLVGPRLFTVSSWGLAMMPL